MKIVLYIILILTVGCASTSEQISKKENDLDMPVCSEQTILKHAYHLYSSKNRINNIEKNIIELVENYIFDTESFQKRIPGTGLRGLNDDNGQRIFWIAIILLTSDYRNCQSAGDSLYIQELKKIYLFETVNDECRADMNVFQIARVYLINYFGIDVDECFNKYKKGEK